MNLIIFVLLNPKSNVNASWVEQALRRSDIGYPGCSHRGGSWGAKARESGMRDAKRKGKVKCSIALGRLHPGTFFGRKGSSLACPGVNSYSIIMDVEKSQATLPPPCVKGGTWRKLKHCIEFTKGMLLYPLVLLDS